MKPTPLFIAPSDTWTRDMTAAAFFARRYPGRPYRRCECGGYAVDGAADAVGRRWRVTLASVVAGEWVGVVYEDEDTGEGDRDG